MENSIEKQSDKEEQKFIEKYGMWIIVIGLVATIIIIKVLLDIF
jgi:hypothetical protein